MNRIDVDLQEELHDNLKDASITPKFLRLMLNASHWTGQVILNNFCLHKYLEQESAH